MKLNPLSEALLSKSVHRPVIFSNIESIDFVDQKLTALPEEIAPFFDQLNNQPFLKLKPRPHHNQTPLTVGVVFSGGQAPGGHNVVWGLYETLKRIHPDSKLLGFLDGPSALIEGRYKEITKETLDKYRNLGGFNMIGSGRTKIESQEQLEKAFKTAQHLKLDGFVIIGGDDSNTNAAILAQYFKKHGAKTAVCGVPKTIDGDLQNDYIEISFGFDTACKLYSELIGNILTDAISAKKYYHFIKLMGRSASHIALECALQTHPNLVFIGEEVLDKKYSLSDIIDQIVELIILRASKGKNYGVVLIPEGLIDFIPSFIELNHHLNHLLVAQQNTSEDFIKKLPASSYHFFKSLPENIQRQLLLDRDPHGNIQLAKIDTHKLLIEMTEKALDKAKEKGLYQGKFNPHSHYFGYEGRCANPSSFDAEYTHALGCTAALLIRGKHTGYLACVKNLKQRSDDWEIHGVPIASLLNIEQRHGENKPVIKKALVDLKGKHFKKLKAEEKDWLIDDHYNAPGPIQHFGDKKICETRNHLLDLL